MNGDLGSPFPLAKHIHLFAKYPKIPRFLGPNLKLTTDYRAALDIPYNLI